MHSLGSCVLHLHIDKVFPTIFEVTNMKGPMILSRVQAKAMGYVQFPQIRRPHALTTFTDASRNLCIPRTPTPKTKQTQQTTEPVLPHIKWNTDSIQLNGKTHKLPITKEYILKEYHDIFKGVGTLPGGPYHIRLKEQYRLV